MGVAIGNVIVVIITILLMIYTVHLLIDSMRPKPSRNYRPDYRSKAFRDEFSRNRRVALNRDGRRCQMCGRHVPGLHVHHKIMRSRGGTNDLWNLTTLCPDCHRRAHGRRL